MNIITKKELFIAFVTSHRIVVVLILAAIGSMYITNELDLGGGTFYFLFALFSLGVVYLYVHFFHKAVQGKIRQSYDALSGNLAKMDYWHWFNYSSIAVDVGAEQIAIIRQGEVSPIVFKLQDIREVSVSVYESNHVRSKTLTYGAAGWNVSYDQSRSYSDAVENERRETLAADNTGIKIKLKSLQTPAIFVVLPESNIDYWMLLLENMTMKQANGTLKPTFLPAS
ncbi:hypothetical protein [Vibrio splendidus]|uniref:hypothetical protein n=1 Tax=Vibrio splendidus TaxID=29497 RepID=UPI003D100A28